MIVHAKRPTHFGAHGGVALSWTDPWRAIARVLSFGAGAGGDRSVWKARAILGAETLSQLVMGFSCLLVIHFSISVVGGVFD